MSEDRLLERFQQFEDYLDHKFDQKFAEFEEKFLTKLEFDKAMTHLDNLYYDLQNLKSENSALAEWVRKLDGKVYSHEHIMNIIKSRLNI